jgi:glucokinase
MVDGHLLRGHSGKAGHVGHISLDPQGAPDICGTPGSLELAIGNATILERTGGRFATTHELVCAYEEGDRGAAGCWLTSVQALAAGIVSLSNVLDPALVVIGGGIAGAGDSLFEPLCERVARMEWKVASHPLPIVPAVLGDKAGACGAARQALLQRSSHSHE